MIPVPAYQDLPADRFGGMAPNLLHQDGGFIAPLHPKDVDPVYRGSAIDAAALLCINPDTTGLGKSWIAPEDAAATLERLTSAEREILSKTAYSYLPTHGLTDVIGLKQFPVIYEGVDGNPHFHFSGKLIRHIQGNPDALAMDGTQRREAIKALERLNTVLMAKVIEFPLLPGDILFANQQTTFHGREEVGDPNRLLAQYFLQRTPVAPILSSVTSLES